MTLVIDAGAVAELVLARGYDAPILEALRGVDGAVRTPQLMDLEVLSVVRRLRRQGVITGTAAEFAVAALTASPIVRVPHGPLLPRAWELRDRMSPYDAAYVALAEVGGPEGGPGTLVTTDRGLAHAVDALGSVAAVVVPAP